MILKIDPASIEGMPGKPRIPVGVAAAAALAGEPEAMEDWIASSLKRKALKMTEGDEAAACEMVKGIIDKVEITMEFA